MLLLLLHITSSPNSLVQEIKYHIFFVEGASHVLVLDLLQDKVAGRANLPWIKSAIRTVRMMRPKSEGRWALTEDLADNLERMVRFVYPDFRATSGETQSASPAVGTPAENNPRANLAQRPLQPNPHPDSSMFFGLGASPSTMSPSALFNPENTGQPADLPAGDGGWNFDFATADMEAFLSIDPNLDSYQLPTYP
jgi:hypothetical protein